MDDLELDLGLDAEQLALREAARRFAREVLRPTGIALDRMSPDAVVAAGSPLFDAVRQASELGYTRMAGPGALGGMELPPLSRQLVLEELSYGSLGLAGVIFLASTHAEMALFSGNAAAIEEFSAPFFASSDGSILGCWAVTEPDHGSDSLGVMRPELRVSAAGQLIGRRDGDDWILRGQKSAWVSNGPIATHAMLNVQLGAERGLDHSGVFLLPLDLPGISRGSPLDKHGVRALPQSEIFFDDVRVPGRYLVIGPEIYAAYMEAHLSAFNAGVASMAAGLARAAFAAALAYTKERIQGGRPIFKHQSVRGRLFRMYSLVQAARCLARAAFVYNMTQLTTGQPARLQDSIGAKVFCTQAAHEVATLAVQLHGGVGMTREYPVELFLRDATALTIADGENAYLSQIGAALL